MSIKAQAADDTIHEFPDGTSPAVIDKVMRDYALSTAPPPEQPKPNAAWDAARSIPGGIAKGVAGLVGLPGDLANLAYKAGNAVGGMIRPDTPEAPPLKANPYPTSEQVGNVISAPTGGFYQPQTAPGRYAETIASFAPAALAPGSIPARIARVAIPGAASETAGELTQGTGLEPYARVAGAVAGGLVAGPAIRSINALTSRAGVPLEDPNIAARTMMADAVRRDGGADAVQGNLDAWRGNSAPAVIDVTGSNVRRLVRSAASGGAGEAQNVATTYADRIAGNLQDNSLAVSRRLTPGEGASATAYAEQLDKAQRAAADTEYKAPYQQPATVTKEMVSALQGPEGRGAISQAYADARANRDLQQMGELKDLQEIASEQGATADPLTGQRRTLQQALGELSSGSLDRVRIAMRDSGRALAAKGRNSRAGGYFGRVKDIDTALDQTPGLKDARANFAGFERQKEALDLGSTGMNAPPEDYGATIARLSSQSPGAPRAAGIGYRQAITDAISRPAEGATGVLNRLATSDANTRNLSATFGDQAARDFQAGIGNEADRVRNARFISPNTGSQTALRTEDAALVDLAAPHLNLVQRAIDLIKAGTQLTDQERTALVRLGTTEAKLKDLAKANPSLSSRALTQAVLGANSNQK